MAIFKKQDTWWIDYYANGTRKREKIGTSHKLAQEVLAKRKVEIAEGKFFPERQKKTISFSEMADLYWELHGKQVPSAVGIFYHLKQLKAFFASKPLEQISVPDVLQYLNGIKEKCSAATANRHHNVLRAIFNRAIEWEKHDGRNPAAKVKQFRVENSRTKFLENEDITRLLAVCDAEVQPIVIFALLTGMRRGEIVGLRWEHIDLANGVIHVLKTKSGEPREIPIAAKLRVLIESIRKGDGGRVFNISTRALNRHFTKALLLAGIQDFRFHDLRHTFASHFIMRTNDLPATQKLLGHKSPRMTQRYAHLSKGHLQVEMQIFDSGWTDIWTENDATKLIQKHEPTILNNHII
ncbi:MAG: site-specific integrase [Elusimicrobiales bacterium]|nr:site-specific integrase [Elusimicrobiales bacterium]